MVAAHAEVGVAGQAGNLEVEAFEQPSQAPALFWVTIEHREMRPLGHQHDGVEAERLGAPQEIVESQPRLARPYPRITNGMESSFHDGLMPGNSRPSTHSGSNATTMQVTLSREPRSSAVLTR